MDPLAAAIAFFLTALPVTIAPGVDTALILRTAAVEGGKKALIAGFGIMLGVLCWGVFASVGLKAALMLSETAFTAIRLLGAVWLIWLGFSMAKAAWRGRSLPKASEIRESSSAGWFAKGFATNILNPKCGAFYISLLPQFIPPDVNLLSFSLLLAALHAVQGLCWFLILILFAGALSRFLRKPSTLRALDGFTGGLLILFGVGLALENRTR